MNQPVEDARRPGLANRGNVIGLGLFALAAVGAYGFRVGLEKGVHMEYLIIAIVIWAACGRIAAFIAESRGGSSVAGFFVGALFGPLGILASFFMGTEEGRAKAGLATGATKKCPRCAEVVKAEAQICRFCQHEFTAGEALAPVAPPPAPPPADPIKADSVTPLLWAGGVVAIILIVSALMTGTTKTPATNYGLSNAEQSRDDATSAAADATSAADNALAEVERLEAAARTATRSKPKAKSLCYKGYCPCEPPQEGMDRYLCDQLEAGIDVDVQMMINGKAMREIRPELEAM